MIGRVYLLGGAMNTVWCMLLHGTLDIPCHQRQQGAGPLRHAHILQTALVRLHTALEEVPDTTQEERADRHSAHNFDECQTTWGAPELAHALSMPFFSVRPTELVSADIRCQAHLVRLRWPRPHHSYVHGQEIFGFLTHLGLPAKRLGSHV